MSAVPRCAAKAGYPSGRELRKIIDLAERVGRVQWAHGLLAAAVPIIQQGHRQRDKLSIRIADELMPTA